MTRLIWVSCLGMACGTPPDPTSPAEPPRETAEPTPVAPQEPDVTADTGPPQTHDTDIEPSVVDCDQLPVGPLPFRSLDGLAVNEDFAFDDQGQLLSFNVTNVLMAQAYPPGPQRPIASVSAQGGAPASLRALPGGDIVYADVDTASLHRVSMDGATWVVHGGLGYPTGIDIHPSGHVFLADLIGLLRIDPDTGETEVVMDMSTFRTPNGLTFSAAYDRLYLGTLNGVFAIPVDGDGVPSGEAQLLGQAPGSAEMLGMGVDACDNLYVLLRDALLRIDVQSGTVDELVRVAPGAFMTNLQWGSGIGGWAADKIYITDRNFSTPTYYEVDVGVGSKPYAYP